MGAMMNKKNVTMKIRIAALTSKLSYVFWGGIVTSMGVLGTHVLGMVALDLPCQLEGNIMILLGSVLFASWCTVLAFWIIFRVVCNF